MAYTTIPASSSGGTASTAWAATKLARAQAISTTLTGYWYTDFLLTGVEWVPGAFNASGTANWNDATHAAIPASCIQLDSTGAQSAHFVTYGLTGQVATPKVTPWYLAARVKYPIAPDANDVVYVELRVPSGANVGFGLRGAQSTTKFVLDIAGATFVTGAVNVDQLVHEIELFFDGTNVTATVDGAPCCTTAVLTNVPNTPMGPSLIVQGAGTTQQLLVDKLLVAFPNGI